MQPSLPDPDLAIAGLASAALAEQVNEVLAARRGTLAGNLIGFARLLRSADFDITAGRVIDAARALALIDIGREGDVRLALAANLVSDNTLQPAFDQWFDLYWRGGNRVMPAMAPPEPNKQQSQRGRLTAQTRAVPLAAHAPEGDNPDATAGDADLLTTKDFAGFTDADIVRARRLIRQLAPKLATALARRTRVSRRGSAVDLRRSLRRSVRHGGELLDLLYRHRRHRRLRIVLLCDVSGSMDRYARFLVQLMYALQNELRGVSTFVFSTRLHEISQLLKTRDFEQALTRLSVEVDAWSGGTSIGGSLATFEREYARRRVDSRTVVVIISDGWERGDVEELRRAMAALHRRSFKVMWLNPLLGGKGYQPLARGMAAALPHTDYFLPAHNLESLVRVARTLEHLARA